MPRSKHPNEEFIDNPNAQEAQQAFLDASAQYAQCQEDVAAAKAEQKAAVEAFGSSYSAEGSGPGFQANAVRLAKSNAIVDACNAALKDAKEEYQEAWQLYEPFDRGDANIPRPDLDDSEE